MNVKVETVVFLLVALFTIVRAIFRFFKWAGRQITGGTVGANPIRQAMANAQRQMQAPPPSQARPPARPMPRQPEADSPVKSDAAKNADIQRRKEELRVENERAYAHFRRRAEELRAEEEELGGDAALRVPLQSPTPTVAAAARLFGSSDDLVRAIILREALGPPLSRRSPATPRPPLPP